MKTKLGIVALPEASKRKATSSPNTRLKHCLLEQALALLVVFVGHTSMPAIFVKANSLLQFQASPNNTFRASKMPYHFSQVLNTYIT